MDSYKTRLKDITTFIFDVDGVMTNGKLFTLMMEKLIDNSMQKMAML